MEAFVRRLPQGWEDPRGGHVDHGASPRTQKRRKTQAPEIVLRTPSADLESPPSGDDLVIDGNRTRIPDARLTDVEKALPATQDDASAIEEYELLNSPRQASTGDTAPGRAPKLWRSSIYVDAFNLALKTVLDEESQLFDEKELDVFRQWEILNYEAQYLYVRLFLRKTAAWHRCSRLGYHNDIADLSAAVKALQNAKQLPQTTKSNQDIAFSGLDIDRFRLSDSFAFADSSDEYMTTVADAAPLLHLDELKELAKDAKVQGRNKAEIVHNLCQISQQQIGLAALGLSRQNSCDSDASEEPKKGRPTKRSIFRREDSSQEKHFLARILSILGPCIRLSPITFKLFERVHLIFYRSTEWTEKSLTTIILAKFAKRTFPNYVVCRTSTIFASREHVLEFEAAIRLEAEVDNILEFSGPLTEAGLQRVVEVFELIFPRWETFVAEEHDKERHFYEHGEGAYLRRFNPAHSYTRIIHKAMYVFGRRKDHAKEHKLLSTLLDQKLFHLARRGSWYQRKALLEEHYMALLDEKACSTSNNAAKRRWCEIAVATCETGLQDPDCHLIHHYDLQKRLLRLERRLRIPRRLQHDFGHVRLAEPEEVNIEGIQLKRSLVPKPGALAASTKTIWLDELDTGGECSVEEMCLSHFRSKGWKGFHAEGGVIRTLFAYLFYDILFLYIPNVFQTPYQTCPLDLHTDAFFPARASEINHRLVEIANGKGEALVRQVWNEERERRTNVVGLKWDFDVEDLVELVSCFEGSALAAICKVMAQEYKQRGGGVPDLLLWKMNPRAVSDQMTETGSGSAKGDVMFAEVKSANDRLSDTQRLWIHVLTGAGVKVALCNAIARDVKEMD